MSGGSLLMFAFSDTILPAFLTETAEFCALCDASSVGKYFVSKMGVLDVVDTLTLTDESDSTVSDFALDIILELAGSLGVDTLPPSVTGFKIPGGIFGIAGSMLGVT